LKFKCKIASFGISLRLLANPSKSLSCGKSRCKDESFGSFLSASERVLNSFGEISKTERSRDNFERRVNFERAEKSESRPFLFF